MKKSDKPRKRSRKSFNKEQEEEKREEQEEVKDKKGEEGSGQKKYMMQTRNQKLLSRIKRLSLKEVSINEEFCTICMDEISKKCILDGCTHIFCL